MNIDFDLFPGGVRRGLTMSFDDGKEADVRLSELFSKFNIKGTFHMNSANINKESYVTDEQVREIAQKHEISVHGKTHPFLDKIPLQFALQEVLEDKEYLESLSEAPVRGMSYPYGTYTEELLPVLRATGMEYSRTIDNSFSFYLPQDFMKWNPTCHQSHDLDKYWDKLMKCNKHIRLFYIWGHSYEFDRDNSWERMEEFCKKASNHEDIWYATNIQIKDYVTAMRSLIFTADKRHVFNPTAQEVWFSVNREPVHIAPGETISLQSFGE